jgi:hypothetical protein
LESLKTALLKTLQSGFINYKSRLKIIKTIIGIMSLIVGVICIFLNENTVGGGLIGFGVALSLSKIK